MKIIPFAPLWLLLKMAFKNGGVSLNRIPVFILYILRYVLLEPFRLVEMLLYQSKIKSHVLSEPPIFILGHWRSGTSFTQGLFSHDPRMTSSTIFRSLFSDCFYLTESWLKPFLNLICRIFNVPYSIQRIPMDLNLPSEIDMGLIPLASDKCYSWGHVFPKKFHQWVDNLVLFQDESIVEEWLHDYDYFIRKLSYRAKGKRVVVKSPGDTGRINYLLRKYPDASFIYVHRDPYDVYQSNVYLWKVIMHETGLQNISSSALHDLIVSSYKKLITNYLNHRANIPPSKLIELQFENVIKDPIKELTRAYAALGLGSVPEKEIQLFLKTHQSKQLTSYSIDDQIKKELDREWAFAFNFNEQS